MRVSLLVVLPLLLLPGLAHSVICKTVGADGVTSFTDVPAAECPRGSRIREYSPPAAVVEQAGSVDTGVSARQVEFADYESIEIVSPEADGTVQHNSGNVQVSIKLDPGLQQSHFITAYLDGKAFRGRYGSGQVSLTGVDRGTHKLHVKVADSKGKILIKSDTISFTVRQTPPKLIVNRITGDDHVDKYDPRRVSIVGCYECEIRRSGEDPSTLLKPPPAHEALPAWVTLWFPTSGWKSGPVRVLPNPETVEYVINTQNGPKTVVETYNWEVQAVPRELLATEASFEARVRVYPRQYEKDNAPSEDEVPLVEYKTTSTHSVGQSAFKAVYGLPPVDYTAPPAADFSRKEGGISATPGRTNPAFKPQYAP